MRFALRNSVRAQLTLAILLTILCSWVLSSGITSYVAYRRVVTLRQEMLKRPDLYPMPMPEPRFGVRDFLFGPGFELRPPPSPPPGHPPGPPPFVRGLSEPDMAFPPPPRDRAHPPFREPFFGGVATVRVVIALALALLAGAWLSRRFSRPLGRLAEGAGAFESGDLTHRIPAGGDDEFARVADAMNAMAERVADQIGHLEEDARRRRQFLADVAHELRSPVTTLRTMAGALQDGTAGSPERRDKAVASLVRTSDRLLNLISDLLVLARLDLKELPMHPRPVDLRELAAAAVNARMSSAAKALVVLQPVEHGEPVTVSVDPDRIAQVLDNLLDNAISHAGEGAEVRVTVEPGARLTVSDTGRGIPEEHLPYLFEPFYRVDSARTPGDSHAGLGLRIARALVEAHGGKLTLTSAQGAGRHRHSPSSQRLTLLRRNEQPHLGV